MAEYLVEIPGARDLSDINLKISGEEAGASEFVTSNIAFYAGRITNIVKFKEWPPGMVPKQFTLVKHNEQPPGGTQHVWSGVMIVQGTNEAVSAYRAV